MVSKDCLAHLRRLAGESSKGARLNGPVSSRLVTPLQPPLTPHKPRRSARTFATVTDAPPITTSANDIPAPKRSKFETVPDLNTHITTTIYDFPSMEPLRFAYYPHKHLQLPLRRDILHKAVVYEGDKTRQGTASTKYRDEVHGSHAKVHPQKGMGLARAGDKQSPIRVGGGVAFGPKPRDFATGLNKKVYDLAWRIALSYRYNRGELFVVNKLRNLESAQDWYLRQVFKENRWKNAVLIPFGRDGKRELFQTMDAAQDLGKMREARDVDVKNLLEKRRLIIEKEALDFILKSHVSDLGNRHAMVSSDLPPVIDYAAAEV